MKFKYIVLVLLIFAWPLSYLYGLQLGAVSFLLLALFFLYITIKQFRQFKQPEINGQKERKIKGNIR